MLSAETLWMEKGIHSCPTTIRLNDRLSEELYSSFDVKRHWLETSAQGVTPILLSYLMRKISLLWEQQTIDSVIICCTSSDWRFNLQDSYFCSHFKFFRWEPKLKTSKGFQKHAQAFLDETRRIPVFVPSVEQLALTSYSSSRATKYLKQFLDTHERTLLVIYNPKKFHHTAKRTKVVRQIHKRCSMVQVLGSSQNNLPGFTFRLGKMFGFYEDMNLMEFSRRYETYQDMFIGTKIRVFKGYRNPKELKELINSEVTRLEDYIV